MTNHASRSSLQFQNRLPKHGNLFGRGAEFAKFGFDLVFQVGGIPDSIQEKFEKFIAQNGALLFELRDILIANWHIRAANVQQDLIIILVSPPLES